MLFNSEATMVTGFKRWLSLNRFVKRGEHGISILAPWLFKEDSADPKSPKTLRGFRVAYVFDVSQTEGDPLPEPPDWKSPDRLLFLENALCSPNDLALWDADEKKILVRLDRRTRPLL